MIGSTNAKVSQGNGAQPQLFDIKILESQSASQGWAYICSDDCRNFNSSDVPTLYNNIKNKYDNVSTISVINTNIQKNYVFTPVLFCNNKYYCSNAYYNNGSWVTIGSLPTMFSLATNDSASIIIGIDWDTAVYKINPIDNSYKKIANSSYLSGVEYYDGRDSAYEFNKKEYNNMLYMCNTASRYIHAISTDYNDNTFLTYSFNKTILDYVYINNYWYVATTDGWGYTVYKGRSLSNSDFSDSSKWTSVFTLNGVNDPFIQIFCSNNRIVIFGAYSTYYYTDDDFNHIHTVSISEISYDDRGLTFVRFDGNYLLVQKDSWKMCYCPISLIQSDNNWNSIEFDSIQIPYPVNSVMYAEDYDSNTGIGIILKVELKSLIDKYVIDGEILDISYVKSGNFKICNYNTLDTLNLLYHNYGISNYWNIYNNTVSIPVNKQNYSIMYVGDNFTDDLYE